ncbi:hypothetical protein, partial [Scrofimicrobium canadense]|uniref:hypothetical protein n=1 Tax=Scrofimicrobium canadense TaxID=2652290 RepID=UPI00197D623B
RGPGHDGLESRKLTGGSCALASQTSWLLHAYIIDYWDLPWAALGTSFKGKIRSCIAFMGHR